MCVCVWLFILIFTKGNRKMAAMGILKDPDTYPAHGCHDSVIVLAVSPSNSLKMFECVLVG